MQDNVPTARKRIINERKKAWFQIIAVVVFLIVITIAAYAFGVERYLAELRIFFHEIGFWAPFAFILIYVVASVAAVPRGVLTIIAGTLFGSVNGIIIVSIATTLGAACAFLVSRYLMRRTVEKLFSHNKKYQALNRLTEKKGHLVVAFTRLTPIFPYNFLNYAFGLTRIDFWMYLFWSWLCMLPWSVFYVLGGDAIFRVLEGHRIPWHILLIIILMAFFTVLLMNRIRKSMKAKRKTE